MRSPAAAIGWGFVQRHRPGLQGIAFYLVVLAGIRLWLWSTGRHAALDSGFPFALAAVVPLASIFFYFLVTFSFGTEGDLAARRSVYPTRMFTLPVTSLALSGLPLLYGALAIATVWFPTRLLLAWPPDLVVPLVWPALAAIVFLAWTQAVTWMPYPLPGLRVALIVLWMSVIGMGCFVALELEVAERTMLLLFAPQLPVACLVGLYAVVRARRGATPDWREKIPGLPRTGDRLAGRREHFSSAAQAQRWFEWRRYGRSLPLLVGIVLPFELSLPFAFRDSPSLVLKSLVIVLLTPPFMAAFVAATVSRSSTGGSDSYELTPFIATRPLSSASLIAAKLVVAIASTLLTWMLVLVAAALSLWLSGAWSVVVEAARDVSGFTGTARAAATGLLLLAVLVASTWKQLVRSLYIGMSGRAWLVKGSVFAGVVLFSALVGLIPWVGANLDALVALWKALPWVLAVAACIKLGAAVWIAGRLCERRLLRERTLLFGAAGWLLVVLALFGLLLWLSDFPPSLPRYLFALFAIVTVPFARLAAAPLALAWNRHRGREGRAAASAKARKRAVVAAVLLSIGVPVVLTLAGAVSYHVGNRSNGKIVSSGQEREYLLYVPETYDATTPTPLVISMHGGAAWPAAQKHLTRWNRVADERGFIVVYPSGTGSIRSWETFRPGVRLDDDVRFISELIDTIQAAYNVDATRIYADGMSNGGGMAFVLSCTLSDRLAAVGLVAPAQSLPADWCPNPRPLPMIAFQGTADRFVPHAGGAMYDPVNPDPPVFPPTHDWVGRWAARNRCGASLVESEGTGGVTRLDYTGCAGGAAVRLFTIEGGGHTWPGGEPLPEWFAGPTNRTLDATRRMWAFFQEHRLVR